MTFDDLIANETVAGVRAKLVGYAQAAGLLISNWRVGAVGQQMVETFVEATYGTTAAFARAVRGFASLDTSTDPGDADAFDADNENETPAAGFLSWFGENTFGTVREGETFATGTWTFTNAGPSARTFAPEGLVFTWTVSPPSPAPTYRNTADASVYTNPDGTVTVGVGVSLDIPITADEIGIRSNAPPSAITLTTTLVGVTGTNAAAVLGTAREGADLYRARCRQAPARVSLGGPADAYRYFATKNLDGTPLLNASDTAVNITRVYVSPDSATGIVSTFYASPSGAAAGADVTAANANIQLQCLAVFDAITFIGATAIATAIHVSGSAKIKSRAGVTAAAVKLAIVAALVEAFEAFDIGGFDQDTAGNGVIYTVDFEGIVKAAYPGLYDVAIATPVPSSTALTTGHVATLTSVVGDWSVTVVP